MAGDTQATWGIEIPVVTNADSAADELENLRSQITQDTQSLRGMQSALRALQGGTNVNISTFRKLREEISAKKIAIAGSTQALTQHKDAFKALAPAEAQAVKGSKAYREEQERLAKLGNKEFASGLAHALGILSPRLGHAVRGLQDFGQSAKAMGAVRGIGVGAALGIAAALAAVVVAATAVTYAVAKAITGLIEFGVAAANARRDERLMLQGASATLFWGQATQFAGEQAQLAVDHVARAVPLARAEVAGFAAQLAKAQLKGQDLEKGLRAVSIAASAGQETGGLIGALSMARLGVGSIDALADRIEQRFGHIARAKMLSLDVQTMKLKENFAGLFSKVNVTPFLEGIQKIFSVFDQATVTGYAMRETLTAVFGILGKDFKSATPIVVTLFKVLLLGILQATLAMLKLRAGVQEFIDQHPRLKAFFTDTNAQVDLFRASIEAIPAAIKQMLFMLPMVGPILQAAFDIKPIISGFIDGIVNGIKGGIGRVIAAVRELGSKAVEAFRNVWQTHSPSELTKNIADKGFVQGAVVGLQQGRPRMQEAMRATFQPANDVGAPPPAPAAQGRSGGRGPVTVNIHIHVPAGTQDPEGFGRKAAKGLRDELGDELESIAIEVGATLEVA